MGDYITRNASVSSFLEEKRLAVIGASRSGKKFGNTALKMLVEQGYEVYPVHPEANELEGLECYPDVSSLPDGIGGCLLVVPPSSSEKLIPELAAKGIRKVWMQQGAESDRALQLSRENGMETIARECIFMFAEPVQGGHKIHRWIWKLFGKLPKD